MTINGFEIDFLPVGEKSSSGDSILFRYLEDNEFKIILIDGGHKESEGVKTSDTILNHMRQYYYSGANDKDMRIDHIICSHPDSDHVGGLEEIMEKCDVGSFWINDPSEYIDKGKLTSSTDHDQFSQVDAETVRNLIKVAENNNITVCKPLQGAEIGPLVVASPSKDFYQSLVKGELVRKGEDKSIFMETLQKIVNWVAALWSEDNLKQYPESSVCNEGSTVMFGRLMEEQYQILLTADAGIEALSRAYNYITTAYDYESGSLTFMQIPHHGGRHNLNSEVLDDLLGRKIQESSNDIRGRAYASVAIKAEEYPRKVVLNAFITRGYLCASTAGHVKSYKEGTMPNRAGWVAITPIPYSNHIEAWDQ